MNNLLEHYKTRKPKETVDIIKNFFYSNGFTLEELQNKKTECGTYSCQIGLFKNGQMILNTNGKGLTEEYSFASGYGEAYERFSNKIAFLNSGVTYPKLKELGLNTNTDPRHIQNICEELPLIKEWGSLFFKDNMDLFQRYYLDLTSNNPQADKFMSFDDPDSLSPIVLDSKLLLKMTGSKGMVAGNSLEEAFNQGISELYESWAHDKIYLDPPEQFYMLSDSILSKIPVWENIQKIRELGYILYIFDLGYNYNCPVIATYLVNPKGLNIFLNIGSFPVLDIAVERTITEIYQGILSLAKEYAGVTQTPYKITSPEIALGNNANSLYFLSYDETIFNKVKVVDEASKVFLNSDKNYSNEEINEYYKKLNKEHNFKFYYKDNSLTPEMKALYIICLDMRPWEQILSKYKNINNIFRKKHIEEALFELEAAEKIITDKVFSLDEIIDNILKINNIIMTNPKREGEFVGTLIGADLFSFYKPIFNYTILFNLMDLLIDANNIDDMFSSYYDIIYTQSVIKYKFLNNYILAGYSKEEIRKFYKIFYPNDEISDDDFDNINDSNYLFLNSFVIPFRKYYDSKDYEEVLKVAFKE